jgi:hypothetical protein
MGTLTVDLESGLFFFTDSGAKVPVALDHWRPLVRHFAARCNRFRVDCWPKDAALLDVFQPYSETRSPRPGIPVFATGHLVPELLETILAEPFDADGAVKWFTLMLMQDDRIILSSAHNGAEVRLSEVSSEELDWIRSILPHDDILTVWTAEEMAQMWGNQPVPVDQQSVDDVCRPTTESGLDLNALVDDLLESLLDMMARKVAQDDKATTQRDSTGAKIE